MADYVEIARRFLAGHDLPGAEIPIRPEPQAAPPPAGTAPIKEVTEPTREELDGAGCVLAKAGVRLIGGARGVDAIGIWSDLDGPEVRAAIAVFHPDGVPIRYLDGDGIPMRFKLRRVPGEPATANGFAAMEQEPAEPWKVRDRMLEEMGLSPAPAPWAQYQAERLNELFRTQGAPGRPGRITAATVRHGERGRK